MKTLINVGTSIGYFQNIVIDKPFVEISSADVHKQIDSLINKKGKYTFLIEGWCLIGVFYTVDDLKYAYNAGIKNGSRLNMVDFDSWFYDHYL